MKFKILATLTAFCVLNLTASEPTLKQMASQMVMVGFNGTSTKDASVRAMLSDAGYGRFGGVMLLGRNIQNSAQLTALTSAIKAKQPQIFIAIDEEGGQITRLKDASFGKRAPSAYEVASSLDIRQASELYGNMAKTLKSCGVNLNFAPVLDLHDENSPIIGARGRAFSEYGSKVAFYAQSFIDAHRAQGVLTTLKHFPGHGLSAQDSHTHAAQVQISQEALKPYKEMIDTNRAQLVMIGHLQVNGLDEPATLSHEIITGVLRERLGFDGVVISDDMQMKGVGSMALSEKIVRFINAGGDILLFGEFKIAQNRTADLVVQHILDAVAQKKISKERIKQSYDRIMQLKAQL